MTTNMDVDAPPESGGDSVPKRTLDIHPLALVHMSDQYTRIKCGGSVLSVDAPVVGLLFGRSMDGKQTMIHDAEDISVSATDTTAKQQVSLHQAVFPQHKVVGWYRVVSSSSDAVPTEQDVRQTQSLQQHYCKQEGGDHHHFAFVLLQVTSDEEKMNSDAATEQQELPLSIYEILEDGGSSAVLVNIPQWQLTTTEPERIAIERVVREQPTCTTATTKDTSSKDDVGKNVEEATSGFATQLDTVEQSVHAMKERVQVLISHVQQQDKSMAPDNFAVLREIQGLLCQLGALSNSSSENDQGSTTVLLSHLAAVAKTVCAIQGYTDKFRTVHESRNPRTTRETGGIAGMRF